MAQGAALSLVVVAHKGVAIRRELDRSIKRPLSKSILALPNISLFSIFNLLIWPSTTPLLYSQLYLALTA